MILIIIGILLCFLASYLFYNAKSITYEKDKENELYKNQLIEVVESLEKEKEKQELLLKEKRKEIENDLIREKEKANENLEYYKTTLKYESDAYIEGLKKIAEDRESKHINRIHELELDEKRTQESLLKLKESLAAGTAAQLREREKQEEINFYKITLSPIDLNDIEKINSFKLSLTKPIILNKLIWTSYYQKPTTDLCNRILGTAKKCGIYKITNLKTNQAYVGQSVDISTRWKDHIKCGLGIDAPLTNKLYNNMQEYGVHNFTFELIEECPRDQLNEKERFWIEMFQTDSLGLNSTRGNK